MGKKAADPAEQAAYDAVMKKLGLAKPASSAEAEAAPVAKRCKVDPGSSQEPQQQKEKKKPGPKPKDKGEQPKRKPDDDPGSAVASAKKLKAAAADVETKIRGSHGDEPTPPPAQPEKPPKAKKGKATAPEESKQNTTAAPKESREDTEAAPKESPEDTEAAPKVSNTAKGKAKAKAAPKAKGKAKAKAAATDSKPPATRASKKTTQAAEQGEEKDVEEFWDKDLGMMVSWARFDEVLKKVLELHDETPASIAAALEDVLGPCPQEVAGNIPDYAPGSSRHPGPVLEDASKPDEEEEADDDGDDKDEDDEEEDEEESEEEAKTGPPPEALTATPANPVPVLSPNKVIHLQLKLFVHFFCKVVLDLGCTHPFSCILL